MMVFLICYLVVGLLLAISAGAKTVEGAILILLWPLALVAAALSSMVDNLFD